MVGSWTSGKRRCVWCWSPKTNVKLWERNIFIDYYATHRNRTPLYNGATCSYLSNMYSRFRILPSTNSFSAGVWNIYPSLLFLGLKKKLIQASAFLLWSNSDLLYIFFILEAISIILCKVSSLSRIMNYF